MNPNLKRVLLWYWGCAFNRLLMWLVCCFAIGIPSGLAIGWLMDLLDLHGNFTTDSVSGLLMTAAAYFWLSAVALAALMLVGRFVERRSMDEIGLRWRGLLPELGIGFLAGVGLITLVVIIQAFIGCYRITSFEGLPGVQGFCAAALAMLGVAIIEEVVFRSIVFRIAEDVVGTIGAVIISGLAFGLVHGTNNSASMTSSLYIALEAGLLLAAAYALTRQLWLAIGIHWGWNTSLGSLWGLPVSGDQSIPTIFKAEISGSEFVTGGGFGPEAGLLTLIVCTAAGTILLLLVHRRELLFTPQWMQRLGGRTAEKLKPGRFVEWKRLRQQPPAEELVAPSSDAAPAA